MGGRGWGGGRAVDLVCVQYFVIRDVAVLLLLLLLLLLLVDCVLMFQGRPFGCQILKYRETITRFLMAGGGGGGGEGALICYECSILSLKTLGRGWRNLVRT